LNKESEEEDHIILRLLETTLYAAHKTLEP